jgi:hypothetical protein
LGYEPDSPVGGEISVRVNEDGTRLTFMGHLDGNPEFLMPRELIKMVAPDFVFEVPACEVCGHHEPAQINGPAKED